MYKTIIILSIAMFETIAICSQRINVSDYWVNVEAHDVDDGVQLRSVVVGGSHSCGLNVESQAYCWGNGSNGRLGNGYTGNQISPIKVKGEHTFVILAAGGQYTCGLSTSGEAYCWGEGSWGQLGDGRKTDQLEPIVVNSGKKFTALIAGTYHTCALTQNGQAYCWGNAYNGRLGNGYAFGIVSEPVLVGGELRFVR